MSKYVEKIVNIETGDETMRPYTDEEVAAAEAIQIELEAKEAEAAAKLAARKAVLDKLGITANEAKLLLGGN
jgi:hypothetical protein